MVGVIHQFFNKFRNYTHVFVGIHVPGCSFVQMANGMNAK